MRPPFLVGCGQLCLFSNQIVGFFDYQYLWKKFSYLLDLLHGDSHPAKLASGTTSFDLVYQLFLLSNQIAGFFDHQYLWKESRYIYSFLHGVSHQRKATSEFYFWLGVASYAFSNQVAGFYDHQYMWKELIDHLDFLHGDNHQGKVACETTSFGSMWPVAHFIQSGSRVLLSAIKV